MICITKTLDSLFQHHKSFRRGAMKPFAGLREQGKIARDIVRAADRSANTMKRERR